MRLGKGCRSCRTRHLKCIIKSGNSVCTRCEEAGRDCVFDSKFKFRPVTYIDTTSQGIRSRTDLSYDDDQDWLPTQHPVAFILEDGNGLEFQSVENDTAGEPSMDPSAGAPISRLLNPQTQESSGLQDDQDYNPSVLPSQINETGVALPDGASVGWQRVQNSQPRGLESTLYSADHWSSPASLSELSRRYEGQKPPPTSQPDQYSSPAGLAELAARHETTGSMGTPSMMSFAGPGGLPRLALSRREALLIQYFALKVAPWIDACDQTSQFTLEVPRRATQKHMVLFAVLAAASRHQAIMQSQEEHEASYYHGKCLGLLIDALSEPETSYDENLLVTVVCLRVYEEIDQTTDNHYHLRGVSRLLGAIPSFAHSGGLAEAASWQSLRQDIATSLIRKQPPSLELDHYDRSSVFSFKDDSACANVIVLLLAKILRLLHSPTDDQTSDCWARLEAQVEQWDERRQLLFRPMYSEDVELTQANPFPVICLINAPQVIALQHYHACKSLLLLYRPTGQNLSGFLAAKERRTAERQISGHLSTIIGLAQSNTAFECANFTACHMLRMCGYCVNSPMQREHILLFLERVQSIMAWETTSTVLLLQSQWEDLDGPRT